MWYAAPQQTNEIPQRILEQKKRNKKKRGFSLIEIMVVIIIIGLLAGIVGVSVFQQVTTAQVDTTTTNIRNLQQAIDLYRLNNFSYPTTEQGLKALKEKPEVGKIPKNWNGPYIQGSLPADGWGNEFQYTSDGKDYEIMSYGADGEEGGTEENSDLSSKDL